MKNGVAAGVASDPHDPSEDRYLIQILPNEHFMLQITLDIWAVSSPSFVVLTNLKQQISFNADSEKNTQIKV